MLKPGFEKQVSFEEPRRGEESDILVSLKIRARIRFDYRGKARPSRFFVGGKGTADAAGELREQQAALWRNVPVQGIYIENIEMGEIYTVYDEDAEGEVAFAPLELEVVADTLSFLVRFAVRDEFRRLKIMEPARISMTVQEMEQIFFEVHHQSKTQVMQKVKRYTD